jgi:hypothetical protein
MNAHDDENAPSYGRKKDGRFDLCNPYSFRGGRARAEKVTPERRREIAALGFATLVEKRFGGDATAAKIYIGLLGAWASDAPYRDLFPVFPHPGPMPGAEG